MSESSNGLPAGVHHCRFRHTRGVGHETWHDLTVLVPTGEQATSNGQISRRPGFFTNVLPQAAADTSPPMAASDVCLGNKKPTIGLGGLVRAPTAVTSTQQESSAEYRLSMGDSIPGL